MELDSCDNEVYVPTEPILRPMIRLIIHNAIKYLETKNSRTTLQPYYRKFHPKIQIKYRMK
jgi:hypothetical protein